MKKYTLFFITIYLLLAGLHAQEHYYYYKGEKQFLTLDETRLNITASSSFSKDQIKNDSYFSQLWGLNNTSYSNIDISACAVWNITRGSGIKVAVLDQGIELTHMDLEANISSLSYNSESNSSPSQIFVNHGTHCAGTIGAIKNNNTQIAGVAPECTLMSVSNSLASIPNSRMKRADGINWASENGADIISNSWGSSVQYDAIDEAIDNALVYGRNGKGTLIIFASGNEYGDVAYPANSNPNIIVVGAINMNGTRADFSNYGTELDVVAPGVNILSTVLNNGVASKNGTSMATPHVAGVAAPVLSVNPSLTGQEVRDIIEQSTKKVGNIYNYGNKPNRPNGTWNNQVGYGLIDAYAAVQVACGATTVNFTDHTIDQDTTVTSCGDINVEDVTVESGAKLELKAPGVITIKSEFKIKSGSGFEITR